MKYCKLIITIFFCTIITPLFSQSSISPEYTQTSSINTILSYEKNRSHKEKIVEIINFIDKTYKNIPERIRNGEKITIFFDPAHGKDSTGEWRGTTTNRIGVTGLPEEYYSIFYSRKLYTLLKANKHIDIVTSHDFQKVLDGKSESYHYLKFAETVKMAREAGAFMIIAQHLNNVSIFNKADGRINIPGIHMARDKRNRLLLRNIQGSYSGFLTLYNKFDASGFSKNYAFNIRSSLVGKGYKPNNWEYGAVGDDRFTYYMDFPVSVIYENGFISNPEEEKKLLDPYYMDGIVRSQYDTMLKSLKDLYGVDISTERAKIKHVDYQSRIEMLKLARIAIYYIKNAETLKASKTVGYMKKYSTNKDLKDSVAYYNSIMKKINTSEIQYRKGIARKKRKHYKTARRHFNSAIANLDRNSLYNGYRNKYKEELGLNRGKKSVAAKPANTTNPVKYRESSISVKSSSITKPVIITIEDGSTLCQAIIDALNPDMESLKKIENSMNQYRTVKWVKYRKWSKKHKKKITAWKKVYRDFKFTSGIYVVTLDKNMNVKKAESVSRVYLNPDKYQNQQYLKNSYFEKTDRQRNI